MKSTISITHILIILLIAPALHAQSKDDNIIIEKKIETYTYNISSKQAFIEEKSTTNYLCLKWPEKITVANFYNLYSKIEKVDIKAEKKITPVYEMYRDKDIFYSDMKVCYFELPINPMMRPLTIK